MENEGTFHTHILSADNSGPLTHVLFPAVLLPEPFTRCRVVSGTAVESNRVHLAPVSLLFTNEHIHVVSLPCHNK